MLTVQISLSYCLSEFEIRSENDSSVVRTQ